MLVVALVAAVAVLSGAGSAHGVTCFFADGELDVQLHRGERVTLVREGSALVVRALQLLQHWERDGGARE